MGYSNGLERSPLLQGNDLWGDEGESVEQSGERELVSLLRDSRLSATQSSRSRHPSQSRHRQYRAHRPSNYNTNHQPSRGPSQQQQQQHRHYHHASSAHHNKNPAEDTAITCFSHGLCCCQCVRTQQVGIATENFGAFSHLLKPGFHCLAWPYQGVAGRLSLRVQQLDMVCETKTQDNVFVHISVSVQFRVLPERSFQAFYRLSNPRKQIQSLIFDTVRSKVPNMTLDECFVSSLVAEDIRQRLRFILWDCGYELVHSLITGLSPAATVQNAMNAVQAERRRKDAASHKAEANKSKVVRKAEAEAEARFLSGTGTSRERQAIAQGFQEVACEWQDVDTEIPFHDVVDVLLLTQYMDTLTAVGGDSLVLRAEPAEVNHMQEGLPKSHKVVDLLW